MCMYLSERERERERERESGRGREILLVLKRGISGGWWCDELGDWD